MKQLIYIMAAVSLICPAMAQNVSVFKVDAVNQESRSGQIVRKIKLSLVQNIAGEKRESFDLMVARDVAHPLSVRPTPHSLWFDGSLVDETVTVSYGKAIEKPNFLIVGKEYVNDVSFCVSIPNDLDVDARRQRLDRYLATHPKVFHPMLVRYIADLIVDSGVTEEVWISYVKHNPLGLKDALHARLFDDLSGMVIESIDKKGNNMIDERIWKPRSNLWISEFASQLGENIYSNTAIKNNSVMLLVEHYKRLAKFVTKPTQEEIDKLLSSDALSTEQKSLFK